MRIAPVAVITASLLTSGVALSFAQSPSTPPAHISAVDGAATIDRGGEAEAVVLNMPVVEGDRIRTLAGQVQILFPDGSAVDLDPNSDVEYLGGARIRIYAGTVENHPAIVLRSSQSAEYLPADSQAYATDLDQNGTWQYDTTYGNVWYPTVSADWRPYYYGYWSSVPAYGWTWIGYNRWAWPTHHYGRWGYGHNRWYWIPGNAYSGAWVSWGTAPGYVSWCPLGWDSRPVGALSVGYSHGWNAWTIVPRDHFGWRGYSAHRYAVDPSHIAASTPFIVQRTQPSPSIGGARSAASRGTPQRDGFNRAATDGFNRTPPAGTAAPRSGTSPSYSIRGSAPDTRALTPGVDRRPAASAPSAARRPAESGNLSRPIERGPSATVRPPAPSRSEGINRAPTLQRSAPLHQSAPAPSRPAYERARPIQPPASTPPSSTPRQGGGGGGHVSSAPHAERAPAGGSHSGGSNGGGSHSSGSHGSGSQGTAVRRPR